MRDRGGRGGLTVCSGVEESVRAALLIAMCAHAVACAGDPPPPPRTPLTGPMSYFLSVAHRNEMSATFQLVGLTIAVDGAPVAHLSVPVADDQAEIQPLPDALCAYRGAVQAGTHEVRCDAEYRGHGYGVFSYLRGYRFRVTSRTAANVPRDAFGVEVTSVGYENGDATAPLEDRPQIRFEVTPHRENPNTGCRPEASLATVAR